MSCLPEQGRPLRRDDGRPLEIAVVGAGIAGLATAWLLRERHRVTLFEASDRIGGHVNTVDVALGDARVPVDTGFIVHNEETYPSFTRLLAHLRIPTLATSMSFAVSCRGGAIEYAGTARGLLANPGNLARPAFWRMLADLRRFNRAAERFLDDPAQGEPTLAQFLRAQALSPAFGELYLYPMVGAIWSAPTELIQTYPARALLAFFRNHGLLQLRPTQCWRTIEGGARCYVERLSAPLAGRIVTGAPVRAIRRHDLGVAVDVEDGRGARFDAVVLAVHARRALQLLTPPTTTERRVLGSFGVQGNRAVLHSDPGLMPRRRAAWASWNYVAGEGSGERASVTYWMNRLQRLAVPQPLLVTLNPLHMPKESLVHGVFDYEHPVLDAPAAAGQAAIPSIQGRGGVWYAGAWLAHGFHEDGLSSALAIARAFGIDPPWHAEGPSRRGTAPGLPDRAAAAPA